MFRICSSATPCSAISDSRSSLAMARTFGSAVASSCSTISPIRCIRFWRSLSGGICSFKVNSKRAAATDAADYHCAQACLFPSPPPASTRKPGASSVLAKHRRVMRFEHLAIAQVHVHAAGQAGVKAAHGAHDVYAFKFIRAVLFEDGCVLHCVFVGAGRPVYIARIGVPRGGRIRMVIRDLAIADHHVMRQNPAHRFVEAAADSFLRDTEF